MQAQRLVAPPAAFVVDQHPVFAQTVVVLPAPPAPVAFHQRLQRLAHRTVGRGLLRFPAPTAVAATGQARRLAGPALAQPLRHQRVGHLAAYGRGRYFFRNTSLLARFSRLSSA